MRGWSSTDCSTVKTFEQPSLLSRSQSTVQQKYGFFGLFFATSIFLLLAAISWGKRSERGACPMKICFRLALWHWISYPIRSHARSWAASPVLSNQEPLILHNTGHSPMNDTQLRAEHFRTAYMTVNPTLERSTRKIGEGSMLCYKTLSEFIMWFIYEYVQLPILLANCLKGSFWSYSNYLPL